MNRLSTSFTGARVVLLSFAWVVVVYLVASPLGLYYEALAAWYTLPVLALTYVYCLSHRRRETPVVAAIATVVVLLLLGFAAVIPKGSAA